ncbi:MAG: NAD(P)H-dependent oxidoreductase [Crocinitomicaceae bacterium]
MEIRADLIQSLKKRYAVKRFDPTKKLSDDDVNALLEAGRLTATSYGLQLMKFVLVEGADAREALVTASFGQRQVADASHLIVLCRERDLDVAHFEEYVENISNVRGIQKKDLNPFKQMMARSILSKTKEEQEVWMEKQVYIALGNLLTSCAVLGIDACPMEGFVPEEYDKILGLEKENLSAVLALPIGHRAEDDPNARHKKVRRSAHQFILRI